MAATSSVDGIPLAVEGAGAQTVLMLHGWPDTATLWDEQVAALSPHLRCARATLPGFDPDAPRRPTTLAEMTAWIGRVCDAVSPDRPVHLLLHDWGCFFGYQYALSQPQRIARMVGVDVGDAGSPEHLRALPARAKAMLGGYQLWLALAWRLGGRTGDAMTRRMARWIGAPAEPRRITAAMNYPYDMQWTGSYGGLRQARPFWPPVPMLYVYGRRKPFQFHSPQWLARLEADPAHRVLAFDAGHWVMRDRPRQFNEAVGEWLGA